MLNQFENLVAFPSKPVDLLIDLKTISTAYLSTLEIQNLLQFFRKRNHKHYMIIKFLFSTGASIPEITCFTINHLDFEQEFVVIHERKRLGFRRINLEKEFAKELYRFCLDHESNSHLFQGRKGQKRNVRSIQKILNTASTFLGKEVTIPIIRDFLALGLFDQGETLRDIQNFLGHRSQKSTRNRIFKPNTFVQSTMGHNFIGWKEKAA